MEAIYKANDDTEHPTPEAATRHNAILAAAEAAMESLAELRRLSAEGTLTADGRPFSLDVREYYYILDGGEWAAPTVWRLLIWPYSVRIDQHGAEFVVKNADGRNTFHKISSLYVSKKAAVAAAIRLAEEKLADLAQRVERMKKAGEVTICY